MIVLLALFAFIATWQNFNYAFIFLFFLFYALFREIFSFLKFRKNIIKEATIIKNSLIYHLSTDFYIYIISFFVSVFAFLSLFLNLISFDKQDFIFLFLLLPLTLFFLKKKLYLQFVDNAYNDFRIIIIASFFIALIYAFFKLFFVNFDDLSLSNLNDLIVHYKNSTCFVFDFISQILNILSALKIYFLLSLGEFWFGIFNFFMDFFNFFILCSVLAYIYNFAFKNSKKLYVFILSVIMGFGLFFLGESKNQNLKPLQKEIILMGENLKFLKEQNLSSLKQDKENLEKNLKQVQELLNKNTFELGIWWFSKEKEDLQKMLNENLQ